MKDVKYMRISSNYMSWFPGELDYVSKNKSKGANKGHKEVWVLRELSEGAWERYLDFVRQCEPVNYALAILHLCYLDMRRELLAHNDADDFTDFQDEVRRTMRDYKVPAKLVRRYLKLTFDEVRDPQSKRVECPVMDY